MSREKLGRYMEVEKLERKPGCKTGRWYILNARYGSVLGIVAWRGGWRQYVFDAEQAYFSHDCLRDIAGFVERQNEAYKQEARQCDGRS